MVRNSEKKMTRKIRKNRQTRRKRVLKMKTKMRKNRMHKTMKGGAKLREQLMPTGELGKQLNLHLNLIAESIKTKNPEEDKFITAYYNALELTNPTVHEQGLESVASEAPMIQFIPDSFLGNIPDPIQVLILEIVEQYSELCSSAFNWMNPCGKGHQLTPDKFNEMLHKVCMGEVHNTSMCFGGIRSFVGHGSTDYVNLQKSLFNMVEKSNPDYSNYSTTFDSITSPPEDNNLNFNIMLKSSQLDRWDRLAQLGQLGESERASLSVSSSVLQIYSQLYNLLKNDLLNPDKIINDLLDPNKIICKACIIVMPPFKKALPPPPIMGGHGASIPSPITYGYRSFTDRKLFTWKELGQERLKPNSYCASRQNKRVMAPDSKLNYTMSPLVIPSDLLPPLTLNYDFQSRHYSLLQAMKDILVMKLEPTSSYRIEDFIDKKANLKSYFDKNNKLEMTHIYDQPGYYYYYELKIQKTTIPIPVKSADNSYTNINAVIIEFKVFNEDGICSNELIFVSYERPSPADAFSGLTVLPGTVVIDAANVKVSPQEMNSAIHKLFVQKFMELHLSLYQVEPDNSVLDLTDSAGQLASRGPPSSLSIQQPQILQPLHLPDAASDGSTYSDISTIILTRGVSNFSLSIAPATDIQKGAFTAVNAYITKTPRWTLEHGQTIFSVDNRMDGPQEIKVNVRVLTVDNPPSKRLLSATYQAQDSVPHLLFANATEARKYIDSRPMF